MYSKFENNFIKFNKAILAQAVDSTQVMEL